VKTMQIHRVYKKCPECGKDFAEFYNDMRKTGERFDPNDMLNNTVTYTSFNFFKCLGCGNCWKEKARV